LRTPLVIILFTSCFGSITAQSLRSDSIAAVTLSSHELAAYDALLIFSEVQIGCKTYEVSKVNCWKNFLSTAVDDSTGGVNIPWELKSQHGFIGKINACDITDSIWSSSWQINVPQKDTVEFFYLNFEDNLGSLYSTAAKDNEHWHGVWSAIEATGELPTSLLSTLFNSEKNLLLSDPKMTLLLSLQMMTLIKNN
jgi:hypothetical protein